MKWSKKQTRSLIHIVKDLNMAIPPEETDPEWMNIDRFLQKSGEFKNLFRLLTSVLTFLLNHQLVPHTKSFVESCANLWRNHQRCSLIGNSIRTSRKSSLKHSMSKKTSTCRQSRKLDARLVCSLNLDWMSFNLCLKHESIAQFLILMPCSLNNCFPVCTIWTKEQNLNSRLRLWHWCTSFSSIKMIIYCAEDETIPSIIAIKMTKV